jgi:acyl-coenzyme A thioesterase PaaI-like protein
VGDSPGGRLGASWQRLSRLPGGKWLFSILLGWWVPYTGSIRPRVRELRPGFARVTMGDRRAVRNHLKSIHAVALVNLGEVTSGLAMITALPAGTRSIVTGLTVDFVKKARGPLMAECQCQVPAGISEATEQVVIAAISDLSGEAVARVKVTWLLSPAVNRT